MSVRSPYDFSPSLCGLPQIPKAPALDLHLSIANEFTKIIRFSLFIYLFSVCFCNHLNSKH